MSWAPLDFLKSRPSTVRAVVLGVTLGLYYRWSTLRQYLNSGSDSDGPGEGHYMFGSQDSVEKNIATIFRFFDSSSCGYITADDMKVFCQSIQKSGSNTEHALVEKLMSRADSNYSQLITVKEFRRFFVTLLRITFNRIDKNNSGTIEGSEFACFLDLVGRRGVTSGHRRDRSRATPAQLSAPSSSSSTVAPSPSPSVRVFAQSSPSSDDGLRVDAEMAHPFSDSDSDDDSDDHRVPPTPLAIERALSGYLPANVATDGLRKGLSFKTFVAVMASMMANAVRSGQGSQFPLTLKSLVSLHATDTDWKQAVSFISSHYDSPNFQEVGAESKQSGASQPTFDTDAAVEHVVSSVESAGVPAVSDQMPLGAVLRREWKRINPQWGSKGVIRLQDYKQAVWENDNPGTLLQEPLPKEMAEVVDEFCRNFVGKPLARCTNDTEITFWQVANKLLHHSAIDVVVVAPPTPQ